MSVHLLDIRRGAAVIGETLDPPLTDVFAAEDSIAERVVQCGATRGFYSPNGSRDAYEPGTEGTYECIGTSQRYVDVGGITVAPSLVKNVALTLRPRATHAELGAAVVPRHEQVRIRRYVGIEVQVMEGQRAARSSTSTARPRPFSPARGPGAPPPSRVGSRFRGRQTTRVDRASACRWDS